MNFKVHIAVFSLIALLAACGAPGIDEAGVDGTVTVPAGLQAKAAGPLFIGVSRTDDVDLMKSDPLNQIITIVPAEETSFYIDLSGTASPGDEVFIFAFYDNDYSGGIPDPTPGDIIGFYINSGTLATKVCLGEDSTGLSLDAERMTYDIDPEIIGIIEGTGSGDVIMIAYAGDFNSLDFRDIDKSAIIGYTRFTKKSGPCTYSMKIMPYITPEKYSMPIMGVYVVALLDVNSNGIPDEGDLIGYAGENGYPESINVQDGANSTANIRFARTITGSSGTENPLRITGTFDAPDGYSAGSPVFIIVARSGDPNEVFSDMNSTVKYLKDVSASYNSTDSTFSFDEDLSSSGLAAGDTVMIIALWDRDYTGFPEATCGDMTGFIQNKENFAFTVQLSAGDNMIVKGSGGSYSFNAASGYDFSFKRMIYGHSATIRFRLQQGNLSSTNWAEGNRVQVIALYDSSGSSLINKSIDMDSIIATTSVLITHDTSDSTVSTRYTLPVMTAIPSSISGISTNPDDFEIPYIYIAAFLDSNGNGKPDSGEKVAYYYKTILFIDYPDKITLQNGVNIPGNNVKFKTSY